jgi:NADH-quinone oxidoreductase subunit G
VESAERVTRPQIRKAGKLGRASWEAATRAAGAAFGEAGKNFLILASGRLSNEDLYNLKSLADHVGARIALYSAMGGGDLTALVGVGQGTNLGELGKGATIVVMASDLYQEAPVWYLRVKQAAARGATLIVANPRETKLDRYASLVVRYAYGNEVKAVQDLTRKGKLSDAFTNSKDAAILFGSEGLGLEGSTALAAACARALNETGHVGRANSGLIGVWQRANDQGAWEIGFRPVDNLQAAFDRAAAVYIVGADPFGDGALKLKSRRRKPFLAVQDLFETTTASLADVILPAQAYMERDGTFTSGERRVQRFYPAVPPPDGPLADLAITSQIARQMGVILEGTSAAIVFEIMAAEEDSPFAGLNYARLAESAPQWPIVGRGDMYYGGTTYENTQGLGVQLSNAAQRGEKVGVPRAQKITAQRPHSATRLLAVPVTRLYDRGRTVSTASLLVRRIGEVFVALNPSSAEKAGVADGERVTLSLDGAKEEVTVRIDHSLATGVALIPRSMGLPILEPTPVRIKSTRKAAR